MDHIQTLLSTFLLHSYGLWHKPNVVLGERGRRRLSDAGKICLYSLTQVHVAKSGSALRAGISLEATDHQNVSLWLVSSGQVQDEAERMTEKSF